MNRTVLIVVCGVGDLCESDNSERFAISASNFPPTCPQFVRLSDAAVLKKPPPPPLTTIIHHQQRTRRWERSESSRSQLYHLHSRLLSVHGSVLVKLQHYFTSTRQSLTRQSNVHVMVAVAKCKYRRVKAVVPMTKKSAATYTGAPPQTRKFY